MKHAYPFTIAIPHQRQATIWPGVGHDVDDLHGSIIIEDDEDARQIIEDAPKFRTHQWALIMSLLEEQLAL